MHPKYSIFTGDGEKKSANNIAKLLAPPPWRMFGNNADTRGQGYQASQEEIDVVNAALHLRRPILVTGKPGTGKTSLAYAVQYELELDGVLLWSITSKTTLQQGLYSYDAIARLQNSALLKDKNMTEDEKNNLLHIGDYIRLGALGTAFLNPQNNPQNDSRTLPTNELIEKIPKNKPKVLLIDEIDKSDSDFPNDLLHILEEGSFHIPEIARLPLAEKNMPIVVNLYNDNHGNKGKAQIDASGKVQCGEFPLVIMTSNNERDFPPAFLRRCLRLDIQPPNKERLTNIVLSRIPDSKNMDELEQLIDTFLGLRKDSSGNRALATDQLLNAVYLVLSGYNVTKDKKILEDVILRSLIDS